jgi:hypothetical protein
MHTQKNPKRRLKVRERRKFEYHDVSFFESLLRRGSTQHEADVSPWHFEP